MYGPCTSKSVDWLHLMTHRYSYNISCSVSDTVVLSRLTVVLQGMSSHSYNENIKADSVSAIFVQGFQVEQTIFSLLLLVNGLAVDRLDCTVLQHSSCLLTGHLLMMRLIRIWLCHRYTPTVPETADKVGVAHMSAHMRHKIAPSYNSLITLPPQASVRTRRREAQRWRLAHL